jgi:hypothetical protein
MQEIPKEKPNSGPEPQPGDSTWADDQTDRGYYYDDAHGYENFDPDKDKEEGDDESA